MQPGRLKTLIGVALVVLGLFQAVVYARQGEWIPLALGLLYAVDRLAYLWAEVYGVRT